MNGDAYKYVRYNTAQETRWSTIDEIKQNSSYINLYDEDYSAAGITLISDGKEAYVDDTDTHSLIFGATGSKKTRLFCMPLINIFAKAGESFIVTDPKGELYAQTSGLVEKKGYKTIVLNFRDIGFGDMWNPLTIPYDTWHQGKQDEAGLMLMDFAASIAERQISNTKDVFWPESALSVAIANLYVLMEKATKEEANVTSFSRMCTYDAVEDLQKLAGMMKKDSIPAINYQGTVCIDAKVTISGIISSLFNMVRLFNSNRKLCQMLSANTFDMRTIGREKTAVYIIVPDEKTTYHFLVTTFLKQSYEILISEAQKEQNRQLPVRVNFVLDEFCNIPKIPDMPSMISAARSRNMRYYLVAQSMHQLRGRYGEDADTIKGNCDNWFFLTSKELDLLNEISELCGNVTLPDGRVRRLISPSELQRFSKQKGEALIMHARQYPIISELADISDYKMFGIYPPATMKNLDLTEVKTFSLPDFLQLVEEGKAVVPFPSEEHMLKQAVAIYKAIYKDAGIFAKANVRYRKRNDGSYTGDIHPADFELTEAINKCNEKALQKVVELLGEEFANNFKTNANVEQMMFERRSNFSWMDEDDDD